MPTDISVQEYFEEVFPNEVHVQYQRTQAKLRPWVDVWRSTGDTLNLPFIGEVGMNQKARHGEVTVFRPEEGRIPVVVTDFYSSIQHDQLDQEKTTIQLREKYVQLTDYAAKRKTDQIITQAMDLGATPSLSPAAAMSTGLALDTLTALRENDVEDDMLVGAMSPKGHQQLIQGNAEIQSIDFNIDKPLVNMPQMFRWNGITWMVHNGLPKNAAGTVSSAFVWSRDAVVLSINDDIKTRTDYLPKEVGWLTVTTLSMGAVVRDAEGCFQILVDETA